MSSDKKSAVGTFVLLVIASVVAIVAGGLILDWLKSDKKSAAPPEAAATDKAPPPVAENSSAKVAASAPEQTPPPSDKATLENTSYLGKWYKSDDHRIRLEFLPTGQLILTNDGKMTTFTYTVDEKNVAHFTEDDDKTVEIFLASRDELVYHYHQHNRVFADVDTTARYTRGEPPWLSRNAGAFVATLILVGIIAAIAYKSMKSS